MVYEAKKIDNSLTWNELVRSLPNPHILQTWQWGEQKQQFGWEMLPLAWSLPGGRAQSVALVLKRKISLGRLVLPVCILYAPRGPLVDWQDDAAREQTLTQLEKLARSERAISIKIDPEVVLGTGIPGSLDSCPTSSGGLVQSRLAERGWQYSPAQVQFRNTVLMDLSGSEEDWLAQMKQKTRYNIRLSMRKGIVVREGEADDIPLLYRMYLETSLRDGFVIRSEEYYVSLWNRFLQAGLASLLIAEYEGEPVSGLILFHYGGKAWYFYGMSNGQHSDKMPNYLIQWQAMLTARRHACTTYDMWGAPENFDEHDSMWGVFRFKEGFGGQVTRTLGAWDFAPSQAINRVFTGILPRILNAMRFRRMKHERLEAGLESG